MFTRNTSPTNQITSDLIRYTLALSKTRHELPMYQWNNKTHWSCLEDNIGPVQLVSAVTTNQDHSEYSTITSPSFRQPTNRMSSSHSSIGVWWLTSIQKMLIQWGNFGVDYGLSLSPTNWFLGWCFEPNGRSKRVRNTQTTKRDLKQVGNCSYKSQCCLVDLLLFSEHQHHASGSQ